MMIRFDMLHGVRLSSGKKLFPFTRYSTEDESEIAELRKMQAEHEACKEVVPEKIEAKKQEPKNVDPNDDISLVKGVGAGAAKKLAEAGVTTKSGLKALHQKEPAKVAGIVGPLIAANIEKFFAAEAEEQLAKD